MYCTLSDITIAIPIDEVVQLTDDTNTGNVDVTKVDEAIAKADSLISAFIGGDTLEPVPDLVKQISIELSIYHLYKRRFTSNMPDSLLKSYSHAVDLLKQIQAGKLSIGIIKDEQIVARSYKVNKQKNDRIFGKAQLGTF